MHIGVETCLVINYGLLHHTHTHTHTHEKNYHKSYHKPPITSEINQPCWNNSHPCAFGNTQTCIQKDKNVGAFSCNSVNNFYRVALIVITKQLRKLRILNGPTFCVLTIQIINDFRAKNRFGQILDKKTRVSIMPVFNVLVCTRDSSACVTFSAGVRFGPRAYLQQAGKG